jgi:hypothetical protein
VATSTNTVHNIFTNYLTFRVEHLSIPVWGVEQPNRRGGVVQCVEVAIGSGDEMEKSDLFNAIMGSDMTWEQKWKLYYQCAVGETKLSLK